jgi:hypothetical protein
MLGHSISSFLFNDFYFAPSALSKSHLTLTWGVAPGYLHFAPLALTGDKPTYRQKPDRD